MCKWIIAIGMTELDHKPNKCGRTLTKERRTHKIGLASRQVCDVTVELWPSGP